MTDTLNTTTQPKRTKLLVGVSLIVTGIVGLGVWALLSPGALAYYKTPTELTTSPAQYRGDTIRVGGRVVNGSLDRDGKQVRFTVTDGDNQIPVVFNGAIPDTLKDDTDAIAEGTLATDGTFHARSVQAKCSSKFVPKDKPEHLGA